MFSWKGWTFDILLWPIYIYIPRTQMTLVLIGKCLFFLEGWPSKIEVCWVLGIDIYIYTYNHIYLCHEKTIKMNPSTLHQPNLSTLPLVSYLSNFFPPWHHKICLDSWLPVVKPSNCWKNVSIMFLRDFFSDEHVKKKHLSTYNHVRPSNCKNKKRLQSDWFRLIFPTGI